MSPVGSVGGQFVVLGWLFSEKGISVRNDDKAPSQRVFAKSSPMALGINRTLYWLRVLITWGLGLSWSIALVSELHIFPVDILLYVRS